MNNRNKAVKLVEGEASSITWRGIKFNPNYLATPFTIVPNYNDDDGSYPEEVLKDAEDIMKRHLGTDISAFDVSGEGVAVKNQELARRLNKTYKDNFLSDPNWKARHPNASHRGPGSGPGYIVMDEGEYEGLHYLIVGEGSPSASAVAVNFIRTSDLPKWKEILKDEEPSIIM